MWAIPGLFMNTMNTHEYPNIWVFRGIHYKNLGIHNDEYVFEYPHITLCLAPLVHALTFVCKIFRDRGARLFYQ